MNKDHVKGKAKEMEGTVQKKWGEATDAPKDKVKGTLKEVQGKAQQVKGDIKDAVKSKD